MNIFLFLPLFILAAFLAFYIPGRVVLGKQKNLSKAGIFAVSFILGIVLWGWQGFVFGFLNMRFLTYLYLLIFLVIFVKLKYFLFKIPKIQLRSIDWITLLIVFIGIIGQMLQFVQTGEKAAWGLILGNYNIMDHVWHASLTQELVKRFPPNEPGMYGILLTNYHFWFNLVTAEIVRVFHLPLLQTQFIGTYGIATVLLALVGYAFAIALSKSKIFTRLFLFLLYFSGDATAWFVLILRHRFDLTTSWRFEDATAFMDAPGRGFAFIISMAGLYLLFKNRDKISWKNIVIVGLLFGSLMGFKVYFGIPFILGLLCLAFLDGLKRNFSSFWIFVIASVLSLAEFIPFNSSSGGLFFLPLDIPREFFVQKIMNLGWLDQRWGIYLANHNYLRLIEYGVLMAVGFLIFQLGIKIIGFFPTKNTVNTLGKHFYLFLYSVLSASIILGMFFYQKVGGANIWEFFMTASMILAITVSLNLTPFLVKLNKKMLFIAIAILFVLVLPRWVRAINENIDTVYLSGNSGISNAELNAYSFLKNNTPENSNLLLIGQQRYVHYSSIVNVLAERNLFFSGEGVSQIITPEIKRRENDVNFIKLSKDDRKVDQMLKKDKINYVVLYNDAPIATNTALLKNKYLTQMFSNKPMKIFKVN